MHGIYLKQEIHVSLLNFFLNKFIYLFIWLHWVFVAAHVLFSSCGECRCQAWASHCGGFSCCRARALGAWASVVVACGLSSCGSRAPERRLSSCGARAQLLCSRWDLPRLGLEPVSTELAGGFLTTVPPGKSLKLLFQLLIWFYICKYVLGHKYTTFLTVK